MKLNHKVLGEGQPIIILHGLFGMLDNWQTVAKELSKEFMVFSIDLRNHGKSPHSEAWSVSLMAEDVIEFMHDNWIYEAFLLGHSMGGKVAMEVALAENDMVQKLVVVDIAPKAYEPGHERIFEALQAVPIESIESRSEAEEVIAKYIPELGIRQFLLKNITRNKNGQYQWKMNLASIAKHYDSIIKATPTENQYDSPTLFLRGGNSNYVLDEDIDLINTLFTDSRIETIQDAGHWVHADQKDILTSSVSNFLRS